VPRHRVEDVVGRDAERRSAVAAAGQEADEGARVEARRHQLLRERARPLAERQAVVEHAVARGVEPGHERAERGRRLAARGRAAREVEAGARERVDVRRDRFRVGRVAVAAEMVRTQRVDRHDQHVHAPLRRVALDRGDRRRAEQRRSQETLHRPGDPNGAAGRLFFTTSSRGRAVARDAAPRSSRPNDAKVRKTR
jgi:hypothetical protein